MLRSTGDPVVDPVEGSPDDQDNVPSTNATYSRLNIVSLLEEAIASIPTINVTAGQTIEAGSGTIEIGVHAPPGKLLTLLVDDVDVLSHQLNPGETEHVFSLEVCGRNPDPNTPVACAANEWDGTVAGKEITIEYNSLSLLDDEIFIELAPPIIPGDFSADGEINLDDIAILIAAILESENTDELDFENDGTVDERDLEILINMVLRTYLGDANLDGVFDSADLVAVFEPGEYEDGDNDNSTWEEGDWNGDGDFTTSDLVKAFEDGGYLD